MMPSNVSWSFKKKKKKFYGHINLGKTSFNKANKDLLKALLYSMGTVTH